MFKAGSLYWLFQIVGWSFFGIILIIILYTSDEQEVTAESILYICEIVVLLTCLSHLLRAIFIQFDWLNLKFLPLLSKVIPTCILISFIFLGLLDTIEYLFHRPDEESFNLLSFSINALVYSIFFASWSTFYITYHLVNKSRVQELENLKLEASQNEIELKNLREQLNPHFLFNSLNSIRALIDIEPKTAKTSLTTLSNLLRNSLQMGKKNSVTLNEELDLCKRYLDLESIRFEERLNVSWNVDAPDQLEIPPFIIQTQVENSIKHGISKNLDGGEVQIKINYENKILDIRVENTGELKGISGMGIGIENTKRRLYLHYKDKASFNLSQNGNKVLAQIIINHN